MLPKPKSSRDHAMWNVFFGLPRAPAVPPFELSDFYGMSEALDEIGRQQYGAGWPSEAVDPHAPEYVAAARWFQSRLVSREIQARDEAGMPINSGEWSDPVLFWVAVRMGFWVTYDDRSPTAFYRAARSRYMSDDQRWLFVAKERVQAALEAHPAGILKPSPVAAVSFTSPLGRVSPADMALAYVRRRYGPAAAAPVDVMADCNGNIVAVSARTPSRDQVKCFAEAHSALSAALEAGRLTALVGGDERVNATYWQTGSAVQALRVGRLPQPDGRPFHVDEAAFLAWLAGGAQAADASTMSGEPAPSAHTSARSPTDDIGRKIEATRAEARCKWPDGPPNLNKSRTARQLIDWCRKQGRPLEYGDERSVKDAIFGDSKAAKARGFKGSAWDG